MSVASLGMYDHPAQHAANDALWAAVARSLRVGGVDAPVELDRTRPVEAIWRDPHLLLGQACGYPLVNDADLHLRVVAVPTYDIAGCGAGRHISHLIVREGDEGRRLASFVGQRAAINAVNSNTGYNLFLAALAEHAMELRSFTSVIETGSHRASVATVQAGTADIAAIDAVTWSALYRYEPAAVAGLHILASTPSSPALPFVTVATTNGATLELLRAAVAQVMSDPALASARDTLFLTTVTPATRRRYAALRRSAATERPS